VGVIGVYVNHVWFCNVCVCVERVCMCVDVCAFVCVLVTCIAVVHNPFTHMHTSETVRSCICTSVHR